MQETGVQSLGQEDPLEEGMATHSSVVAWRSPWTEEPGGLSSMESQEEGMTEQLIFCFQELSVPGKLRVSKLLQTFETLQTTADGKYCCFWSASQQLGDRLAFSSILKHQEGASFLHGL